MPLLLPVPSVLTHLKGPEHCIAYDVAARILELFVSSQLDDAIQQVARQPHSPQAHKDGHHQLTALIGLRKEERRGNCSWELKEYAGKYV